ncbi:50S ribosomal protein L21 [Candidatus Cytomitobacter indipagum]|uniref:Large ribosomal subunit protein bL21 n=1 Tax=Candidatus Cytomitobacter indipagum TaxID=2601575 RepID=A0A5C0UEJ7_9PROT|nr:50S ribosomal protein L21 [Candidatus Cytomitobacter indipagum]QEK38101.1 50S ribosomal protein L21 [Candidatus Cytomitobacter indipagum]
MLNAVVQSSGHQYIVSEGSFIKHPTLNNNVGSVIKFNSIWSTGKKCTVEAEVLKHSRHKKVIVFKKIRRHNHRKFNTHRQGYTLLQIKSIKE